MRPVLLLTICLTLSVAGTSGAQGALSAQQSLGRDILRELIETNTTYSSGSTTKAAERMAARFRAAGFPAADVQIVGPDTGRDAKDRNLIVRYRGRGSRKPILLIGHLDVVEARRADWELDPFMLTELSVLSPHRAESRRAQLAAGEGQCDLPPRRCIRPGG
jgi:hypothetical protein